MIENEGLLMPGARAALARMSGAFAIIQYSSLLPVIFRRFIANRIAKTAGCAAVSPREQRA